MLPTYKAIPVNAQICIPTYISDYHRDRKKSQWDEIQNNNKIPRYLFDPMTCISEQWSRLYGLSFLWQSQLRPCIVIMLGFKATPLKWPISIRRNRWPYKREALYSVQEVASDSLCYTGITKQPFPTACKLHKVPHLTGFKFLTLFSRFLHILSTQRLCMFENEISPEQRCSYYRKWRKLERSCTRQKVAVCSKL